MDMELTQRARRGDLNEVKRLVQDEYADVNTKNEHNKTALYYACENGHTEVAQYLLENGASVHLGDIPLTVAVRNKHMSVVRLLLTNGAHPDTIHEGYYNNYRCTLPLHMAAAQGDSELVELLLQHGAGTEVKDVGGNTPLHHAVEHHQPTATSSQYSDDVVMANSVNVKSVCDVLLENNADVNVVNKNGETPLYRAASAGLLDIVRKMLEVYGGNPNLGSPLAVACIMENVELADMLLKHGSDPNQASMSLCSNGKLPLHIAATVGNGELVELLLKHGAEIHGAGTKGDTALHYALKHYNKASQYTDKVVALCDVIPVIDVLLEHKADVNIANNSGETPLFRAAYRGMLDVVRKMLQVYGGNPNKGSPLTAACHTQNVEIAYMMLEHGADPNLFCDVNSKHKLPLLAAADKDSSEVVELLLKYGAEIDVTDSDGNTALHHAIEHCSSQLSGYSHEVMALSNPTKSVIDILLEKKADVNIPNNDGETPLYRAVYGDLTDVVRTMLQNYAGNPNKGSPLTAACLTQNVEIVDMLLEHRADPNLASTSRCLPLLVTAVKNNSELAELLLKHGANIDVTDSEGNTALHHAIEHCSYQESHKVVDPSSAKSIIDVLLQSKADVNFLNNDGETPLCRAARKGFVDIVRKMLQVYGGNPNKGSPLAAACLAQNVEIVDMLLNHEPRADPNMQSTSCNPNPKYKLPLFIAVDKDNCELVELLLRHGARIDTTDSDGNTVLHHAVKLHQSTTSSQYSDEVMDVDGVKSVLDVLLEHNADVNTVNIAGETPLYRAASRGLLNIVCKMMELHGGNPNTGSPDKRPLAAACTIQNIGLVDMLLKHAADPNQASMGWFLDSGDIPLFIAVQKGNSGIVRLLINAGASVNAVNVEGKSVVCFAAEKLTGSMSLYRSTGDLSVIRLLLQHGAHFNTLMPDGKLVVYLIVDALKKMQGHDQYGTCVELLHLMVKHGAMLLYSSQLRGSDTPQSHTYARLKALATFDGKFKFIVDLLRAGAGFRLIASFCNAVATPNRRAKSIRLCQAAVLAGYTLSTGELHNLQLAAGSDAVLDQLVNWLNEDRQQVPSLLRQCRVVIRRQLSAAVHYQTILPAIDKLEDLPISLKLYLQFDGGRSEVDLSVN